MSQDPPSLNPIVNGVPSQQEASRWPPCNRQTRVCYESWLRDLLALRLPLETTDKPAGFGGLFTLGPLARIKTRRADFDPPANFNDVS